MFAFPWHRCLEDARYVFVLDAGGWGKRGREGKEGEGGGWEGVGREGCHIPPPGVGSWCRVYLASPKDTWAAPGSHVSAKTP